MDETNSFSATDETRMKHGSESETLLLLSLSVFNPCFIRGSMSLPFSSFRGSTLPTASIRGDTHQAPMVLWSRNSTM